MPHAKAAKAEKEKGEDKGGLLIIPFSLYPFSLRPLRPLREAFRPGLAYQPSSLAKISGATMVASLSMTYFGVSLPSLPQVIFSFGTAPE
jgi:hypothetical protein